MFLDCSLQCKIEGGGGMCTKGIPGCNGHVFFDTNMLLP